MGSAADRIEGFGSVSSGIGFIGKHELRIDDKGRLSIPSRFKTVLIEQHPDDGMQVVVSPSLDMNLIVQPASEFAKLAVEFEQYNELDEEARRLKEILIGLATQEKVDASGRIRLSADLRKLANLNHDVTVIGENRFFTVWDRERWNATESAALRDLKHLAEQVRVKNRAEKT
jgi:MraZ protein